METAIFTRKGVKRIMRFAFDLARTRPARHLSCVTKSNAQRHGMVLWDEIFAEIAGDYPEIATDKVLVDAMTTRTVLDPKSLDVIVATNLHTDILSDLAAALTGSLGLAPTANLNPEGRFSSMFEPIHGSGFDIMGQGIANPVGAFWSASIMLDHLGETEAAAALLVAIEDVLDSILRDITIYLNNLSIVTQPPPFDVLTTEFAVSPKTTSAAASARGARAPGWYFR